MLDTAHKLTETICATHLNSIAPEATRATDLPLPATSTISGYQATAISYRSYLNQSGSDVGKSFFLMNDQLGIYNQGSRAAAYKGVSPSRPLVVSSSSHSSAYQDVFPIGNLQTARKCWIASFRPDCERRF
jgi:hypothetical protein